MHLHTQVCQWDAESNVFNVIGTADEVKWKIESTENFIVTLGKGAKIFNGNIR